MLKKTYHVNYVKSAQKDDLSTVFSLEKVEKYKRKLWAVY